MAKTCLTALAALLLFACPVFAGAPELVQKEFTEIGKLARDTQVRWYMWGGSARINQWVDDYVAGELKSRYGIRLVRVPMDASVFVNRLLNEKAAGKKTGSIDLLWINGENFKNCMEAGVLFGPFSDRLPNFRYVDPATVAHDFGYPVKNHEAPFGRAQFVFEYDTARTEDPPKTFAALRKWIEDNPGRFTYPMPPDFTGSAFIRQVLYATTGGHARYMDGWDGELFRNNAPRLWEYLSGISEYLWQGGRTYPAHAGALDTLFARGEVDFGMSYHPPHAQSRILDGAYPDTVRTFAMEEGSLFNTHFTAIPLTAPNKAGALVTANFLLSPEAQLSKFDPENWGDFPAIDMTRLDESMRARFSAVDLGPATLAPAELTPLAVPEIPSAYVEALEEGWEENVLR
ncbi:MAG: ABC transporter substrate-binding protein [Desulfatibacillaceae bacterium]